MLSLAVSWHYIWHLYSKLLDSLGQCDFFILFMSYLFIYLLTYFIIFLTFLLFIYFLSRHISVFLKTSLTGTNSFQRFLTTNQIVSFFLDALLWNNIFCIWFARQDKTPSYFLNFTTFYDITCFPLLVLHVKSFFFFFFLVTHRDVAIPSFAGDMT